MAKPEMKQLSGVFIFYGSGELYCFSGCVFGRRSCRHAPYRWPRLSFQAGVRDWGRWRSWRVSCQGYSTRPESQRRGRHFIHSWAVALLNHPYVQVINESNYRTKYRTYSVSHDFGHSMKTGFSSHILKYHTTLLVSFRLSSLWGFRLDHDMILLN